MTTGSTKGLEQNPPLTPAIPGEDGAAFACPMSTPAARRRRLFWRLGPFALFLVCLAVASWRGWISPVSLETVAALHDRFHAMIALHPAVFLGAYTLLYLLVGVLCVPGAAFLTAAGGMVFGTAAGAAATVIGATIGATILFMLARNACAEFLERSQGEWMRRLRDGFARDAFNYLLFLRLAPVFPFWFVNIAAAALGVPLRTFVIATFIGIAPATVGFASAGASLRHVFEGARAKYEACLALGNAAACRLEIPPQSLFTRDLALALVLLGLLALVPVIIKKWRRSDV